MITSAALVTALAFGAATAEAPAMAPEQAPQTQFAEEGGGEAAAGEPGFFEKYYPFTFADGLEAETDDNFVLLYVFGVGWFLANIWGPIILIGNPGDYLIDSIIILVVHIIPAILLGWIPLVNLVVWAATFFYLMPVATVNAFDRNLKNAKAAGTWKAAANRKVRPPDRDQMAAVGTPAMAF